MESRMLGSRGNHSNRNECEPSLGEHQLRKELRITRVLVADFEGPEAERYQITTEVIERLREATAKNPDIEIVGLGTGIKVDDGPTSARRLSQQRNAKLVIWGSYGKTTTTARMILHVECFNGMRDATFVKQGILQGIPAESLDNFTFQTNLGTDLAHVTLTLAGVTKVLAKEYEEAWPLLTSAIELGQKSGNYNKNWLPFEVAI
jgi:hypothetical protein